MLHKSNQKKKYSDEIRKSRMKTVQFFVKKIRNFVSNNAKNRITFVFDGDNSLIDGIGSQIQRQISVFAAAKYLNFEFIGRPIEQLMLRASDFREGRTEDDILRIVNDLVAKCIEISTVPKNYNAKYTRTLSITPKGYFWDRLKYRRPRAFMVTLASLSILTRRNLKVYLSDGFFLTKKFPELYEQINSASARNYLNQHLIQDTNSKNSFVIAVHIRRGEVHQNSNIEELKRRYLPIHRHLEVLKLVLKLPEVQNRRVTIKIMSDSPIRDSKLAEETNQHQLWKDQLGIEKEYLFESENFSELKKLHPNLEICQDLDSISSLAQFAFANCLLMSKSSFSYVGALLNKGDLVVYEEFWHSPLAKWVQVSGALELS